MSAFKVPEGGKLSRREALQYLALIYTDASGDGGLGAVVLRKDSVRIFHGRARGSDFGDIYFVEILGLSNE